MENAADTAQSGCLSIEGLVFQSSNGDRRAAVDARKSESHPAETGGQAVSSSMLGAVRIAARLEFHSTVTRLGRQPRPNLVWRIGTHLSPASWNLSTAERSSTTEFVLQLRNGLGRVP